MGHLGRKIGQALAIGGLFICVALLDQPVKSGHGCSGNDVQG
jgi:hypothetical protein